ncbi:GNAT family acetyltransferase [Aspergillus bombycis]|uniref:GNAT family acetyltransferase n=1 Tax=Aspergillus bombycis TaxID=109264 RepID=A0A1F8A2T3_9EURO|nr:GNAT family acetyltransferase [Aspergillus bombycis]OGM46026.1 GNAT family acetyltransferase [Aspergillus bombycis]
MSTDQYEYLFFHIDKENAIESSAKKYKQLRLQALSVAPTSFSSTYEIESSLTDTEWVDRLSANGRETFICAARPTQNNAPCSQTTEWVGQLTLRGPLSPEDFILPEESGQKKPTQERGMELWQMLSLFTLPDHRGRRLGKRLCQEALRYLASYRDSPRELWVRLMVKPENHATVSLYRGLGFAEAGKCTLVEALVANGDQDLLPENISGEKYTSRSGLIMMLEICRS